MLIAYRVRHQPLCFLASMVQRTIIVLAALVALTESLNAQNASPALSTVKQIQEDVRNVPCRANERQAGVRDLFGKFGAAGGRPR